MHTSCFFLKPRIIRPNWSLLPCCLQSSGDSGANVKRLEQETAAKIEQLNQQAANISPEVIQMLLRHVTTVKN
jgi:V-type H+-transporting ATPase subunit G